MNKTPVSMLQEIMVKKGSIPNYDLIHDGGGTHMNTFTYRVTCDGLSANGTGRCKKDAKHEAAKAMLAAIAAHNNYPQLPASPAESPVRTPVLNTIPVSPRIPPNTPFINAIGALQDLCIENNLDEPEYVPISDVGPPHARIFTIQCLVSSFREEGVSTTKKQAKHEAAKKMMERINNLTIGINDIHAKDNYQNIKNENTPKDINEHIITQYNLFSKLPSAKKINLGIRLTKYHTTLKDSLGRDVTDKLLEGLDKIIPVKVENITNELVTETLSNLEILLSDIDIMIYLKDLPVNTEDTFMKVIHVDTSPSLTQIGIGKSEEEASFKGLSDMINSLKLLLSE